SLGRVSPRGPHAKDQVSGDKKQGSSLRREVTPLRPKGEQQSSARPRGPRPPIHTRRQDLSWSYHSGEAALTIARKATSIASGKRDGDGSPRNCNGKIMAAVSTPFPWDECHERDRDQDGADAARAVASARGPVA